MTQKNKRTLNAEELEKLYDVAENDRDYILMKVTAKHGLRNSEAISLQPKHIQIKHKFIDIRESKKGKDRLIPIPDNFIGELEVYLNHFDDGDYLFPSKRSDSHLTPRAFQKKVRKYSVEAGLYPDGVSQDQVGNLPYQDRIVPHTLRHTYATRLLKQGVPMAEVQKLLGHESIEVTVDVYHHMDLEQAREAINTVLI
jgi:integrase/recombinase XerD